MKIEMTVLVKIDGVFVCKDIILSQDSTELISQLKHVTDDIKAKIKERHISNRKKLITNP